MLSGCSPSISGSLFVTKTCKTALVHIGLNNVLTHFITLIHIQFSFVAGPPILGWYFRQLRMLRTGQRKARHDNHQLATEVD